MNRFRARRSPTLRSVDLGLWIPALIGIALVVWALIWPSWTNVVDHWQSSGCKSTKGRVKVAKTVEMFRQEQHRSSSRFSYEYDVGGGHYVSTRYSFRFASGDQSAAVESLGRGDEVCVYYDPLFPHRSVIDKEGSPWWNYVVLAFAGIVPAAFGIQWLADSFQENERQATS